MQKNTGRKIICVISVEARLIFLPGITYAAHVENDLKRLPHKENMTIRIGEKTIERFLGNKHMFRKNDNHDEVS